MKISIPLTLEIEYLQDMKDYKYLEIQGVYLSTKKQEPLLDCLIERLNNNICDADVNELVYDRHFGG